MNRPKTRLASIIATWFGSGLSPKAPGTVGSLASLPFAWMLLTYIGATALLIATILVSVLGIWASNVYMANIGGNHDPGEIVVDEVAGQWLTLAPVAIASAPFGPDWLSYVLAFVFFRLFDIWKPWPIRLADKRIEGGFGVMLDDILAGLIAGVFVIGFNWLNVVT